MPKERVVGLDELCRLVDVRAERLGHELGTWTPAPGEEDVAAVASCARCGATAYARIEGGLQGFAGDAVSGACAG